MYKHFLVITFTVLFAGNMLAQNEAGTKPVYDLISRVLPRHAQFFEVAFIPQQQGKDVFEVESRDKKIILRGSNGVSVASALNFT